MSTPDPGFLTQLEHDLIHDLGTFAVRVLSDVVLDGPARDHDSREIVSMVHDLQRALMAQAAARAYPELYRPLGGDRPGPPMVVADKPDGTEPAVVADPVDPPPSLLVRRPELTARFPDLAPGLVEGLAWLGDDFGPTGVLRAAIDLWPQAILPAVMTKSEWEAAGSPTDPNGSGVLVVPDEFDCPEDGPATEFSEEFLARLAGPRGDRNDAW